MNIYVYLNDQQSGPYTPEQIQLFMSEGQVNSQTLAWQEGMPDWVALGTLMQPKSRSVPASAASPAPSHAAAASDRTLGKIFEYLDSVLVPNEKIEHWAIQTRLHGLLQRRRRSVVAVTTGRFIVLKRGLFGGFQMGDIRWQDMHDTKIQVGIFTASIKVIYGGIADMASWSTTVGNAVIGGLRKDQAHAVYRTCQAQDQAWREKRRIREMEEMRARSGVFQTQNGVGQASDGATDSMTRLQQAKQMLESRLITDAEYEAMKAKIINSV